MSPDLPAFSAGRAAHSSAAPISARLLRALEQRGTSPALIWYGEDGRTELSGHVLANWLQKNVNFLRDELYAEDGTSLVIAMPPHWKRLVMALCGWLIGLDTRVAEPSGTLADLDATILTTDSPELDGAEDAEELVLLEPVSLALRFSGEVPPLAHDWLPSVRGHGDALSAPVTAWSGPGGTEITSAAAELSTLEGPAALETIDGDDAARAIAVWLAGGCVIAPASALSDADRDGEGVRS